MEIYAVLKIVWWLLVGVLLVGIATMMGTDLGIGAVLRLVGRTDRERGQALEVIAPHWDSNQVWFVLTGGIMFAAWPLVYATAFSGLYVVMMVLLWTMILRPLGFEYRSKLAASGWRNLWDWALVISGVIPMLVFGAAVGNLFQGLPFRFDWQLASRYTGSFLDLFNPFALFCGVLALSLAVYMGATRLMISTGGRLHRRARMLAWFAALLAVASFAVGGHWVSGMDGYRLVHTAPIGSAQTPLQQSVQLEAGAWMGNFRQHPWGWLLPTAVGISLSIGAVVLRAGRALLAWWLGAAAWTGVIGTAGFALFPFLMPSSIRPDQSLTVWNAAAGPYTLSRMLAAMAILLPLVIWYVGWSFQVMRGKVSGEHPVVERRVRD